KVVRSELDSSAPSNVMTTEEVVYVTDLRANRNSWAREGSNGDQTSTQVPNNSAYYWTFNVPSGATNLTATISGDDPNANVYIRRNDRPATNQGANNTQRCSATGSNSNESCTIASPQSGGTWYAAVRAANGNSDAFAGVTLRVTYEMNREG